MAADDAGIRRTFPYPIASAWARVHRATTDVDKIPRLESALEIVLRTLAAFAVADYLRGPPAAPVEEALSTLQRPSLGHYAFLLQESVRALRDRPGPAPFVPELQASWFDPKGRLAAPARLLGEAITLRNEIRHKGGASTPAQLREKRDELSERLRPALLGLSWLDGYRLFRVRDITPTRRRTSEGQLQFFCGEQEHTDPVPAEWGQATNLLGATIYLVDREGTGVLEVSPLIDVLTDSRTGQEHLFVMRDAPGMKRLARSNDESGSVETKAIEVDGKEVTFSEWLAQRESFERYHRLQGGSSAFHAVVAAEPAAPPQPAAVVATPVSDPPAAVPEHVAPPPKELEAHAAGTERLNDRDGTVLLWVPPGEYLQGSDENSDAKPTHRVKLSGFWIAKYPVTNKQYGVFLKATGRARPKEWTDPRYNAPDQPVVGVSWHDAVAYCDWAGLRLPTEAQWEAAARGTDGRRYPWGNQAATGAHCNFEGAKVGKPTAVRAYPSGAGPFGALDQAGNAWEWCFDLYDRDAYKNRSPAGWNPVAAGSEDRAAKGQRTCRGGSFNSGIVVVRAAFRGHEAPTMTYVNTGFRCARAAG